jgi:hypothetical protein
VIRVGTTPVRLGLRDRPVAPIAVLNQGGASFSPLATPSLAAWWDLTDLSTLFTDAARTTPVVANNDPIGGVTDKSGGGSHLSIATAGLRPLYKAGIYGALGAALFDGVDDELHSTGPVASIVSGTDMPVSVIMALTWNWTSGNTCMCSWGGSASGNPYYNLDITATRAARFQHRDDTATQQADQDAGTGTNVAHVVSLLYTGTAATWRVDGTPLASPAQPVTVDVGATTLNQFSLGSLWRNAATGANFWNSYSAEVVVSSSALSAANANLVEKYMGTKLGITVA